MRKWLTIGLLLVGLSAYGQLDKAREIVKTLCSPEFHGRGYVQGGDSLAAEFIASEFSKSGLKPLGKSYFQPFSFAVNTFPSDMSLIMDDVALIPGEHFIVDPTSPSFSGTRELLRLTPAQLVDQVQLEQFLKVLSTDINAYAIVFDLRNTDEDTLKELRGASRDLAGIAPVIELTNDKLTWSMAQAQGKFPIIYVNAPGDLSNYSTATITVKAQLLDHHVARNVIGYLPAKKKTKKTIVLTAHYDHLGRMGKNTYFPGANDNASGTAMLIHLADYFKQNPVPYNVVFIAFAGEEVGLLGSRYFTENPLIKLNQISFLVNVDIMGSGEDGITVVNGTKHKDQFDLLQELSEDKNLLKQVKIRGEAANSDHYWFSELGVPAFFIYTMGPNKHYHDVLDTYEELSFAEFSDITQLIAEFVRLGKF